MRMVASARAGSLRSRKRRRNGGGRVTDDRYGYFLIRPPSSVTRSPLFPLQLDDLIGLGAAGGDDLDLGAFLLADQRAGQRRGDGDLALLGVGLGLADDLPHRLLVGVRVDPRAGGSNADGVA